MKLLFLITLIGLLGAHLAFCYSPEATEQKSKGIGPDFKGPVGLQLYSLRNQFASNVPSTLDQVRNFGFQYVELAGTYGVTSAKFKELLDTRGLKAISGHFSYEQCRDQ